MIYILRCWQRLGDILLCFPAAKFLHDQGHKVQIECLGAYHSIFEAIDYATPIVPGTVPAGKVLTMGIHPTGGGSLVRYRAFRSSGRPWQDWVYSQIPDLGEAGCRGGPPKFTKRNFTTRGYYGLPEKYVLVAPYGHSQVVKYRPEALIDAMKARNPKTKLYVLTDAPTRSPMHINARRLSHLIDIISWADDFATINSAPAIIAAGLGRPYLHFPQINGSAQDDTRYLSAAAQLPT